MPKTDRSIPVPERKTERSPSEPSTRQSHAVIRQPTFSWTTPIILSIGLLSLTFLAWIYWQDVPLASDADLRLTQPVDQTITVTAPHRLRSFLDSISPADPSVSHPQSPWEWDTPSLSDFVGSNGAAFDNLRDLLEDYDWHPRHSSWYLSDIGSNPAWHQADLLLRAQAAYLVRRGDEESAFSTAIDLAELSRRLEDLWAWPSFGNRSLELHLGCVQTLAELLKRTRLDSTALGRFQKEFTDCTPSRAVMQDALSAYYLFEKKLLLGRQSGEPLDTMPMGLTQRRPGRVFFKMHQTLNLFGQSFRDLKAELGAPPNAAYSTAERRTRQTAPQFYKPNAAGEHYFSDRIDAYLDLPQEFNLAVARHDLTLCLFGVRRYVADRHALPPSLDALSPAYLPKIPTDPFSGDVLQYDAARGRLFSVGVNRVAEGGLIADQPLAEPREPTLDLGIATAAPVGNH